MSTDELLDYRDLAQLLRLRSRQGGWSAEAARALVNRHAELNSVAVPLTPRKPRWRRDDVLAWASHHAAIVASAAGCPDCCRKKPRSDEDDSARERR